MYHALPSFLDALASHLSHLLAQATTWPDIVQQHVHSFAAHLQTMMQTVALGKLSCESNYSLNGLWFNLQTLELIQPSPEIDSVLQMIRTLLSQVSHMIDQHLSYQFAV